MVHVIRKILVVNAVLALAVLCACPLALYAQAHAVKSYDYPAKDGVEEMNDYEVSVRGAEGGEWVSLKTLRCDVDMHKVQKASFAEFDMGKPVVVRVRNNRDDALSAGQMDVIVRP